MTRFVKRLSNKFTKATATNGSVEVSNLIYHPGSYSRNANGLVTVVMQGPHGYNSSSKVYIKFISGNAISSLFTQISVVSATSFTVQDSESGITSGDVLVARITFNKSGTYSRDSHYGIVIHIETHNYVKGTSIYVKYTSGLAQSGPAVIEKVNNNSSFRILKKADPGGFYSEFGVNKFHQTNTYGNGVKVYVIDEGFNDIDPHTPGIQTTSDLAEFTMVNISTPGAGGGGLSHGGLVCALLGASRRNGAGIIGLCPDSHLFLADVDDQAGDIFISKVVQAIDDAVARQVDVINISLGTSTSSSSLEQAVQRALNANILIFASAGNSGKAGYEYPSSYPGVISVGSVNIHRRPSSFNTRNERVSVFAPGEKYPLPSPLDVTDVVHVDGTSFSSPFAAGLAALYISKRRQELNNPSFRPSREEVISVITGVEYMNTSGISYNTPSNLSPSNNGISAIVAVIFVIGVFLLFAMIASSRMKSIRVVN
jgi:subtilisin